MLIDGKIIKCSAWKTFSVEITTSLVVVFTRTSGDPPSYERIGMFRRAQCAGEAFADVWGEAYPVIFAIPSAKVSSQTAFFGKDRTPEGDAGVSPHELWAILKAAQVGRTVYLVCVGVDAFTTDIDNYLIMADKYEHLKIAIILVVPKLFKEAKEVLQIAYNGIRYDAVPLPTTNPTIDDESALNLGLLWRHHNLRSAARGRGVRGRVCRAAWCQRDLRRLVAGVETTCYWSIVATVAYLSLLS
jgi:hypothetical protein